MLSPEENNNLIFSEISNDVVSFNSTWKTERATDFVNAYVETDPIQVKIDKSTETIKMIDTATQTDNKQTHTSVNENQLADWLNRIYPLVEKQLKSGITKIFDQNTNENELIRFTRNQIISLKTSINQDNEMYGNQEFINSSVAWLSIKTGTKSVVAVSCFPNHNSWCDHVNSFITIFVPQVSSNGHMIYNEIKKIMVKSCILHLSTNLYNKDMFAGGSISGELYIWKFNYSTNDVEELACESYQQGLITGLCWIKNNNFSNDYALLTCHIDGYIILWKIGKQITIEKKFKIYSRTKKDETIALSAIAALTGSEFVVGTEDGKLFLCSASQFLPMKSEKNVFDPIINELESHKFAVTSLVLSNLKEKPVLLSCDLSGEIFIYDIGKLMKKEASIIIKMPLPFKNKISCTKNLDYILSPGNNGSLNLLKLSSGEISKIDGTLNGMGNTITISENGFWIICGTYCGNFQLFKVETE